MSAGRAIPLGLIAVVAGGIASDAHAGGVNPWGGRLSDGSTAVTPYLYVLEGGEVSTSAYVQQSFAGHLDVLVGAGGSFIPGQGGSFGVVDLMPRVFINDSLGFTMRVLAAPDAPLAYGPEIHTIVGGDRFAFTLNAGYRFEDGAQSAFGLMVPEVFAGERLSFFVEVDPTYAFGDGLSMLLVPGVGAVLDRAGKHTAAAGVQIDPIALTPPTVGMWYSTGWGG